MDGMSISEVVMEAARNSNLDESTMKRLEALCMPAEESEEKASETAQQHK